MCGPKATSCLGCGEKINEFNLKGCMKCPDAFKYFDIIKGKMPTFFSEAERNRARKAMEKSGMDVAHIVDNPEKRTYKFYIEEYEEVLKRLIKYESIGGAIFHEGEMICIKCAEKQRCPICKAKLVPL